MTDPFAYDPSNQRLHLHYDTPSTEWPQALPVGNGRLGSMVHGRPGVELLQLNEDSVWYGGPQQRTPLGAAEHLPELRRLIREGRHAEAETIARRHFFASPLTMRVYEPLGEVRVAFNHDASGEVTGYKRWLDVSTATQSTVYAYTNTEGRAVTVRRDVLVSHPDQVVLVRVRASEVIEYPVRLNRKSQFEYETEQFLDSLTSDAHGRAVLHATPGGKGANPLCMVLGARTDAEGSTAAIAGGLLVRAKECVIAIGAHTTFRCADPEAAARADVDAALARTWDELAARHVDDYRALFTKVDLRLTPDLAHIPTDARLKAVNNSDDSDPGLVALYHHYGRYLLLSSSRSASDKPLPANLQGIWNPSFTPAWGCKFTLNINVQMNYWPAACAGLIAACASTPLVDLLERMSKRGEHTAREVYGCAGWCAHSYTDVHADTDPHDDWMPATLWPLGGLWLASDAVEMLKTQYDRGAHERLAPVLRGAVRFVLDVLVEDAAGRYLVTNPSVSPENTFIDGNGNTGILCEGSAMDTTLVRRALLLYQWSEKTLGNSDSSELSARVASTLARLPPIRISPATGLIQEWGAHDYTDAEPGHRHVSHLVGLYPGRELHTPEQREAARKVLAKRAAHGGGHTGWSRAWLVNLHARLGDGEGAGQHVGLLLQKSTMANMLDDHPPFQIDGNFGGAAGVVECLVQSEEGGGDGEDGVVISLLPALPSEWAAEGELRGVYVLGGWRVWFGWKKGAVTGPVRVVCEEGALAATATVVFPGGARVRVSGGGEHEVSAQ